MISLFSSIIGVAYSYISYYYLFDFSNTIPFWKIVSTYIFLGLLFSGIYYLVWEYFYRSILFVNVVVVLVTLVSILLPIIVNIEEDFPEMFPSFAIPLHFIFPLLWLAVFPTFINKNHE